jgi:hypothetical protein
VKEGKLLEDITTSASSLAGKVRRYCTHGVVSVVYRFTMVSTYKYARPFAPKIPCASRIKVEGKGRHRSAQLAATVWNLILRVTIL